jgi:acetyl esterase
VTVLDPLAVALAREFARGLGIRVDGDESVPELPLRRSWAVADIRDTAVPGPGGDVPVRIYRPNEKDGQPILIYMHGGGWLSGDLDMVEENCRELSARADCLVVSVDYSLSPAHKFPVALEEVHAVATWVAANAEALGGDARRLAIGGESAGANLAASECLMARDGDGPEFVLQLLIYPVLDPDMDRAEIRDAVDPILSAGLVAAMWRQYTDGDADLRNPLAVPLLAESLAGLPPAMIVSAATDPLRFEGEAFAAALSEDDTEATYRLYDGTFHGFFGLPHPNAAPAMDDVVSAMRGIFGLAPEDLARASA